MLLVGLVPVKALAVDPVNITEVSLTYVIPLIGESCWADLTLDDSEPEKSCYIDHAYWYDETDKKFVYNTDTFIEGHEYHLEIGLYVRGDNEFPADQYGSYEGTVILNGNSLTSGVKSYYVSLEITSPTVTPLKSIPESISEAEISVSKSPEYSGAPADLSGFGITVSLDGVTLPADAVTMHFYTDVACSNEVVDGSENPCTPTAAGVYYVTAEGVESKGYTGTAGPAQVKVLKQRVAKPQADSTKFVYDGTEKKLDLQPSDPSVYTIKGNSAKEIGVYMAEISLTDPDNCCWAGEDADPTATGTSKPISVSWSIEDAPDTGDSTNPALWSLMMVGSLAAMAACLILRKKDMEY